MILGQAHGYQQEFFKSMRTQLQVTVGDRLAVNRRFRAGAILRQALAHGAPTPDALQQIDAAVVEDPTWYSPRLQRDVSLAAARSVDHPEAAR